MKLPGLIDPHVHLREPGACHKEDFASGTAAALAGGFTTVLAMPNTQPPVTDLTSFDAVCHAASVGARCDYACFAGATEDNVGSVHALAERAAGLKLYLDATYGPLRLDDMIAWSGHMASWPRDRVVAAHAERRTVAALALWASLLDRPVHVCHVAKADEIHVIRRARERGVPLTCEVSPHHLLLCEDDVPALGKGRAAVSPQLGTAEDRAALWANLDIVDCIATDHAPHLLSEKVVEAGSPPGFPGLETALPLMLTCVAEGRLSMADLVAKMHDNPRRIYGLPEQPETWVGIDPDASWEIPDRPPFSKAGWTPFAGWKVRGRVVRVVLRGKDAYREGKMIAQPGWGRDVRVTGGEDPSLQSDA